MVLVKRNAVSPRTVGATSRRSNSLRRVGRSLPRRIGNERPPCDHTLSTRSEAIVVILLTSANGKSAGMAVPSEGIATNVSDGDGLDGLLGEVARGDHAAFERLYRSTSSRLFGICARIIPDHAEAEDTLQEVFTTVWHKAGQFDAARASAMTWLAMIARNKSIDRLRANANLRQNSSIDMAENISDDSPSILEATEFADGQRRLDACLRELDDQRQALLRTAFFEGVTYEELAARTNTPLGTVKSWIRRSLHKLKVCLER